MPRRRYPTIKVGADGLFHAWVTVGTKPNGRPDQRHVKRSTVTQVHERVDELLDQLRKAAVVKPGRQPTLETWLATYLDTIAPRKCDPTTIHGYRSKMRSYVIPACGKVRLDRLTPEHLDEVYLTMQRAGRADATILQVHRILSRALEIALRRGLVPRNVAKLIDAPTAKKPEMKPLSATNAAGVLEAAGGRRNATRWSVGLALGLRQGEALGLRWPYVDLVAGEMRVWWQLHRRQWEHGCQRGSASMPACERKRGGNCPARTRHLRSGEIEVEGGLILKEPKGKSKRTVPIPPELVTLLQAHREVQDLEKMLAGAAYLQHGFVFARPDGRPIDPSADWAEWKQLLEVAGVPDARVHDGRHTAGTLLLAQGVDLRVVQEILGHSSVKVTEGYAHVASEMARDAVGKLGGSLLRKPPV